MSPTDWPIYWDRHPNGSSIINNKEEIMQPIKVGDRIKIIDNTCSHNYIEGSIYVIYKIISNREHHKYFLIDNEVESSYYCYEEDFKLVDYFMRRTIEKGATVKVISKPDVYFDLDDKGKELGATDKWTGKFIPPLNATGEVLGIDDGYAMVDFGAGEALVDVSCLEPQKKKEEVKFLVRYPNGTLEEYSTEKEVEKRMQDLYKAQSIKPGDVIKVYNVEGFKEVKLKIEIAFM